MTQQTLFSFKVLYEKLLLFSFALFFVAGQFFRFIPLAGFSNHISLIELLFYALCIPLYFSQMRKSQALIVLILFSTTYGALLNGFDLGSALYSCKLCAAIIAGIVLGELVDKTYLLKVFTWVLAVSSLIFFVFPQADLFFQFLEGYGIGFEGDPHQRRFISSFFDPNLYAAIACIPLILCITLKRKTLFFLFLASIFLTFSRSGIATCLLLMAPLAFTVKKFTLTSLFLIPLSLICLISFYFQDLATFFDRTLSIGQDPSAHARFVTFTAGWDLFLQHPFFGVGYNYSLPLLDHLRLDSSLLIAFINFGFIPTLIFFGLLIITACQQKKSPFFCYLLYYTLICIGFTSLFNNLLFYQYWLIPMMALFKNESRICT